MNQKKEKLNEHNYKEKKYDKDNEDNSLKYYESKIPENINVLLKEKGFQELRPSQIKSIKQGLFQQKNLLVCTPTASGKTLVAELGFLNIILNKGLKAVYIVPLRALASEKYRQFKKIYPFLKIGISTGDLDQPDTNLGYNDLIIVTSEKFDSLMRHKVSWLKSIGIVIIDEIHLLNDVTRGPTLEIIITLLKKVFNKTQLIGLSATIGNAEELAKWLEAELVLDYWRPVKLKKGVYLEGEIFFDE